MKIRNIISAAAACVVAAAAFAIPASAEESYVAGLTFQTNAYYFRNNIAQSSMLRWDDEMGEAVDLEGASYVDATITGDGTYTVELNGVQDNGWRMLKLETNIDLDAVPATLEITSVELNGAAVDFDKEAAAMKGAGTGSDDYSDWEFSINNTCRAQLINVYDNLEAIPNEAYDSIKVTFTISGLGGDTAAADDTASDATASDAADTTTSAATDASKGSPDTGVEGVAAVAGVAVIAAGAVLMSRKRK